MPKKQKDKPPEYYDGGGPIMSSEEILRSKYPDLEDKYTLYLNAQRLVIRIRSAKLAHEKTHPSMTGYFIGLLNLIICNKMPITQYFESLKCHELKTYQLSDLIYTSITRMDKRKYSYDVLEKLLRD